MQYLFVWKVFFRNEFTLLSSLVFFGNYRGARHSRTLRKRCARYAGIFHINKHYG
uniref:Uncharacterized protein n=1 Tax=Ascaris lumbricoides TaxID=6252 RepID=A0A0M3IXB9_ASCLU